MRSAPRDFSSIPAREAVERRQNQRSPHASAPRVPPSFSKPVNAHVGATLGFGSERRKAWVSLSGFPYEASARVREMARFTEARSEMASNQRFTFGAPPRLTPAASCRQSQP